MKTQNQSTPRSSPQRRLIVELDPERPLDSDQYGTSDLHVAAYLSALGLYLADVRSSEGRTTFVFSDRKACLQASARFHNEDDDAIQASILYAELKKMKVLAHRGGF